MIYRSRKGSDVWHFVKACHWWPALFRNQFVQSLRKPNRGEFCNECRAKAKRHLT